MSEQQTGARPGADEAVPVLAPGLSPEEYRRILAHSGARNGGTLVERCGIELLDVDYDSLTGRMPVEGNIQPHGLFHGGAHVVIAETLASSHAFMRAGGRNVVGVDLNATHVRATREGWVHARAEVIHMGRTMANHEVRMTDDDGRLLSIVRITNMILAQRSKG